MSDALLALAGLVLVVIGAALLRRLDERAWRNAERRDAAARKAALEAAQRRLAEQMRVTGQSLLSNRHYRPSHDHLAPSKRARLASVTTLRTRSTPSTKGENE